jgi:hypothetical protein
MISSSEPAATTKPAIATRPATAIEPATTIKPAATTEPATRDAVPTPADFPKLNVGPGCHAQSDLKNCLDEEQRARDQLAGEWRQFTRGEKGGCIQAEKVSADIQSYADLLTCLEMARDTRKPQRGL